VNHSKEPVPDNAKFCRVAAYFEPSLARPNGGLDQDFPQQMVWNLAGIGLALRLGDFSL
jgi:hypothetical protein